MSLVNRPRIYDAEGAEITDPDLMPPLSRQCYFEWQQKYAQQQLEYQFRLKCESDSTASVIAFLAEHQLEGGALTGGLGAAVRGNNVAVMEELLQRDATIDFSVCNEAALPGKDLVTLQVLKEHGWDINTVIGHQHTALLANIDNDEIVQWCFGNGAIIQSEIENADPCRTFPSLNYVNAAAMHGSVATIKELVSRGAEFVKTGSIALHCACTPSTRRNDAESIRVIAKLIDLGCDPNGSDEILGRRSQGPPLNYALWDMSVPKIKILLENGADPHCKVGVHGTPYSFVHSGLYIFRQRPEVHGAIARMLENVPPS